MNKIFKTIWDKDSRRVVVVSELAKSQGKSSSSTDKRVGLRAVVAAVAMATGGLLSTSIGQEALAATSVDTAAGVIEAWGGNVNDAHSSIAASMALGKQAFVENSNSVAIGDNARIELLPAGTLAQHGGASPGSNSVALGSNAKVRGQQGVAIGNNAEAVMLSTATGQNSRAVGYASVATGQDSNASAQWSTATGVQSKATGSYANALGGRANASNWGSTALGTYTVAGGDEGTAVGYHADVTGRDGTASGAQSLAAEKATATGAQAKAEGTNATASGFKSNASGANSVASGVNSTANASGAIAIGDSSGATAEDAIAIGHGAASGGVSSTAIGDGTMVMPGAVNSTAIGTASSIQGTSTNAYSLGTKNSIGASNVAVVGNNNTITPSASNTMVLGNNITATKPNSVILGEGSTDGAYKQITSVTIPNIADGMSIVYDGFNGTATGVVSIGSKGKERQLTNVAPGEISANSTDTINGSQLYAVAYKLGEQVSNIYFHTNLNDPNQGAGDPATNKGRILDKAGATGAFSITAGVNATASGANGTAIGHGAKSTGDNSIVIGARSNTIETTFNASMGGTPTTGVWAAGQNSTLVGSDIAIYNTQTEKGTANRAYTTNNVTAFGANITASADSVTIGNDAKSIAHETVVIGKGASVQADDGWRAVVVGTNAATTGGQAAHLWYNNPYSTIKNGSSVVQAPGTTDRAWDYATAVGYNAQALDGGAGVALGSNTIVRKGVVDTAATPERKKAIDSETRKLNRNFGVAIGASAQSYGGGVAIGGAAVTQGVNSVAVGRQAAAVNDSAIAIGSTSSAANMGTIAMGNSALADGRRAIAIGNSDSYESYSEATNTRAHGDLSIAFGTRALAGVDSTDSTKGVSAIAIGTNVTASGNQSIALGTGHTVEADNAGAFGDPSHLTADADGSYAIGNNNTITTANTFVLGSGIGRSSTDLAVDSGEGTVANSVYLGNESEVTRGTGGAGTDGVGTLKTWNKDQQSGAIATTAGASGTVSTATVGGITYGTASIGGQAFAGATSDGAVSVGSSGAERRIQNVAAGEISKTSTDAINGSQLYAVAHQAAKPILFKANSNKDGANTTMGYASLNGLERVLGDEIVIKGANENKDLSRNTDAATAGTYSARNVQTVVDNQGVQIQIATNPIFDSVQFGSNSGPKITNDGDNIKVSNSAGDATKITNVANGTNPNDAVNLQQLNATSVSVVAGNNTRVTAKPSTNGGTTYTIDAEKTVVTTGAGLTVTPSDSGNNVTTYNVELDQETQDQLAKEETVSTGTPALVTVTTNATKNSTGGNDFVVNVTKGEFAPVSSTGALTTPTTNGVATVADVVTAVNSGFFTVNANGSKAADIKFGDTLNFVNGTGTTAVVKDGGVAYNTNVDGTTIQIDQATNSLKVNTDALPKTVVAAGNNTNVASKTEGGTTTYTIDAEKTVVTTGTGLTVTPSDSGNNVTTYNVALDQATQDQLAKEETVIAGDSGLVTVDGSATNNTGGKEFKVDITKGAFNGVTTAGKLNADGTTAGVATVADVVTAVNSGFFTVNANGTKAADIKFGDTLNFANGTGTTAVVKDGGVAYNTNVDGTTIQIDPATNSLKVNTDALPKTVVAAGNNTNVASKTEGGTTTYTIDAEKTVVTTGTGLTVTPSDTGNNVTTYNVELDQATQTQLAKEETVIAGDSGLVTVDGSATNSTGGKEFKVDITKGAFNGVTAAGKLNADGTTDGVATVADVIAAVNAIGFNVTTGGNKADGNEEGATLINPGEEITYSAGKNLTVKREGNVFTYATADDVTFNNVSASNLTVGPVTINQDGINAGNTVITNVASGGDTDTNGANIGDIKRIAAKSVEKVVLDDTVADNIATVNTESGDAAGNAGETYKVGVSKQAVKDAAKEAINVTGTAPISVAKTDENGVDTYTVTFDGTKAAESIPLTYKANGAGEQTVNLNEGLDFTSGDKTVATVGANGKVTFDLSDEAKTQLAKEETVSTGTPALVTVTTNATKNSTGGNDFVVNVTKGEFAPVSSTGALTAPTTDGVATVSDVVTAVNSGFFTVNANGTKAADIKFGDTLNFVNGIGTTAVVKDSGISFNVKTDGTTIKVDESGNLTVNTDGLPKTIVTAGNNTHVTATTVDGTTTYTVDAEKTVVTTGTGLTVTSTPGANNVTTYNVALDQAIQDQLAKEESVSAGKNIVVVTNGTNSSGGKDFQVSLADDLDVTSVTAKTINVGPVTINQDGINAGNTTITNVKAGEADTDAVNVAQLNEVKKSTASAKTEVKAGKNVTVTEAKGAAGQTIYTVNAEKSTITQKAGSPVTVTSTTNPTTGVTDYQMDVAVDGDTIKVENGKLVSTANKVRETVVAGSRNVVVTDAKTNATGGKEFTVDLAKDLSLNSVSVTTVNIGPAVSLTAGKSDIDGANELSIGSPNAPTRITNVAPGIRPTDAVNVSQLQALRQDVHTMNRDLKAGVAGAVAIASLPQAYLPGGSLVAAAAGSYKGQSAFAIGASRISDNGKVILKVNGSANTRGDVAAGVGVGYHW